jgi:hypothetical protein
VLLTDTHSRRMSLRIVQAIIVNPDVDFVHGLLLSC